MIESKEIPASIYTFISTEPNVKIETQMINHVVKAFSLESALNSLIAVAPNRNYVSTGYTTLDKFVEGCKIPLTAAPLMIPVDKEKIYKEILADFLKAGDLMFKEKIEKDMFKRLIGRLTNKHVDLKK